MTAAVKPIPEGHHTVTPYRILSGASDAIAFYEKALGAEEVMRLADPGGKVHHAEISIGDSRIMLADEHPEIQALSPKTVGGSPVSINLYVEDVDRAVERAVAAGAKARPAGGRSVLRRSRRRDRGTLRLSVVRRHAQGRSDNRGDSPARRGAEPVALQPRRSQRYIGSDKQGGDCDGRQDPH